MGGALKWIVRTVGYGIIWVFILSINVRGRDLYDHASNFLVHNRFVDAADEKLAILWERVTDSVDRAIATGDDSEIKSKL